MGIVSVGAVLCIEPGRLRGKRWKEGRERGREGQISWEDSDDGVLLVCLRFFLLQEKKKEGDKDDDYDNDVCRR